MLEINLGAIVVTSDGSEIGKVKSVEANAFLVDAPRQFDFWLHRTLAARSTAEQVELSISDADLNAYKMDNPHDHNEFKAQVPAKLRPETVRGSMLER